MIRNITFEPVAAVCDHRPPSAEEYFDSAPPEEKPITLRLRKVTVSPQEEYQLRAGEVSPISDELAAAILSFKGRAVIANKAVVVDRKDIGGKWKYFHEDSVTLNDFSSRERRLFYVINRQAPDILHLLDESGAYIESLPLRESPAVLDQKAQQEQLRQNKAVVNRAAQRLQALHAEDTAEALETLAANSREMTRVVQTLPSPRSADAPPVQPARSTQGEAAAAGAAHINNVRINRASAVAIGRAIAMNRRDTTPASVDAQAEDWSANPRQHRAPAAAEDWSDSPTTPQLQQQTTLEKW